MSSTTSSIVWTLSFYVRDNENNKTQLGASRLAFTSHDAAVKQALFEASEFGFGRDHCIVLDDDSDATCTKIAFRNDDDNTACVVSVAAATVN